MGFVTVGGDGGGGVLFWVLAGDSGGFLAWGFRSFVVEFFSCFC